MRETLGQGEPDSKRMATLSRQFEGWGAKIGTCLAKKGDLVVDEAIKNGMRLGSVSVLVHELRHDLITLAKHMLARF